MIHSILVRAPHLALWGLMGVLIGPSMAQTAAPVQPAVAPNAHIQPVMPAAAQPAPTAAAQPTAVAPNQAAVKPAHAKAKGSARSTHAGKVKVKKAKAHKRKPAHAKPGVVRKAGAHKAKPQARPAVAR